MNFRHIICLGAVFGAALNAAAAAGGQWTQGMDDDAGKAAATSRTDLPAADYEGARKIVERMEAEDVMQGFWDHPAREIVRRVVGEWEDA